jgi:DNA-binding NtrC family response regulator
LQHLAGDVVVARNPALMQQHYYAANLPLVHEALSFIRANPTVFPVIISDFDRPADNDNAHKLIQRLKDSGNAIPVIIYALNFTDKQAEHSVKVIKARAQLKYPLDLLAEVIKLVPPDTLKPSRSETILQAMLGCKFIWKQP